MKFPWTKQEETPKTKRVVGMSGRATAMDKMVSDVKRIKPPTEKIHLPSVAANPYISVVIDDIKRVLHIDAKSRQMKQEYNDFMEHYFGKTK